MSFGDPAYLWLALCPLLAAPLALACARRRRRELARLTGEGAPAPALPGPGWGGGALLLAASGLLVFACCRPQWGSVAEEQPARGADILVALDTSKSMLANDLKPSRLAAAKEAIAALGAGLNGERIGLIDFAGSAFLVCPLTRDYGVFSSALAEAGADSIPLGGTSLAAPLREARRAFSRGAPGAKVLILVSDGEDQAGDYAAEAGALRQAGVTLVCVGAGTLPGALIPLPGGEFLKDAGGAVVKTRLHPATLREIAGGAGGRSLDLSAGGAALAELYRRELAGLERRGGGTAKPRPRERFQLPLALALALLFLEPLLGRRNQR